MTSQRPPPFTAHAPGKAGRAGRERRDIAPQKLAAIRRKLLAWFAGARRPLPWRDGYAPYSVWISEMMLQQTQVETVLPYYARWMRRFPDLAAVAAAPEVAVLKAWEGLGYYSRARNLHRAARIVVADHGGRLPSDAAALRRLPGIGPYTAGAIAAIAFERPEPAVDGNVARVVSRLFAIADRVDRGPGRTLVWNLAARLVERAPPRPWTEALMELGALVCRARAPACAACPLKTSCLAHQLGEPEAYPPRPAKAARREVRGALLLAEWRDRILLRRRPSRALWGGLWEPPWLEADGKESASATLRKLAGKLAMEIPPRPQRVGTLNHGLTHMHLALAVYRIELISGEDAPPKPSPHPSAAAFRWATPRQLPAFPLARLGRKAMEWWRHPPRGAPIGKGG